MKRPLLFVVILFATIRIAAAEWQIVSARSEPSPVTGVEHRQVVAQSSVNGHNVKIDLALFLAKSATLRVIDNPDGSEDVASVMQRAGGLAGVNGGYFDPNFAPIGLRIIDGKTIQPLVRARLLTGVLFSSAGSTQIARVGEFAKHHGVNSAVQCGPLLVDAGQPVRGLDNTRVARRTFALVGGGERAALGLCTEVSLAEAAHILATAQMFEEFKVQRALNLDGGSSSGFWFKRSMGSAFSISEQKSVRDFVGIAPKKN